MILPVELNRVVGTGELGSLESPYAPIVISTPYTCQQVNKKRRPCHGISSQLMDTGELAPPGHLCVPIVISTIYTCQQINKKR